MLCILFLFNFNFCEVLKKALSLGFLNCGCGVMAAAPDLGSGAERRGGSSPFTRTKNLNL